MLNQVAHVVLVAYVDLRLPPTWLLAICAGNSPVPGEFSSQRPVARSFDVFFDLRINKRLSKQWWGWSLPWREGGISFRDANCQPNPGLESLILTQPRIDLRERITRINMVNFASLNGRGIQSDLEKKNLARDLKNYEIDIAAIQETHLKEENGHTTIIGNKKNYDLFYVSNGNNAYHGVGIAVSSNLRCRFQRISDRICKITSDNTEDWKQNKTYKENKPKLVFIAAYAPTLPASIKNEEETDKFYEDHEKATEEIPKRDILVIAGDFDAECGSARERSHPTLGRYGKGVMNENGERLVDFGRRNELFLTNTFFYHKMSHRTTWEMAEQHHQHMDAATKTIRRNRYSNQIDFIMMRTVHKRLVKNARSHGNQNNGGPQII